MEIITKKQDKTSLKKSNTYLLVDVETCNDQRIIMELSFLVINKLMGKKKERCYIIKEVWENPEYRNGKYAIEKLEHWQEMIDNGTAQVVSIYKLYDIINKTIVDKGVNIFSAYNVGFDYKAIEMTYHRYGIDKRKDYKESNKLLGLQKLCLWEYGRKIYCTKDYIKWALKNGKLTPKNKIKSSAESLYQYLIENEEYEETHFGIEDLQIEYTIFIASIIQNTLDRNNSLTLNKNGNWRTVETFKEELREKGLI